jgi:hypothetical protein
MATPFSKSRSGFGMAASASSANSTKSSALGGVEKRMMPHLRAGPRSGQVKVLAKA